MEEYVTVSAKIPKSLRAKMRKLGIRPSAAFRKAINETMMQENAKVLKKEFASVKKIVAKIPLDEIVKSIREDRER